MCLLGTPITPDVAALRWGGSFRLDAVAGCRLMATLCDIVEVGPRSGYGIEGSTSLN